MMDESPSRPVMIGQEAAWASVAAILLGQGESHVRFSVIRK
jgi:hypothetical protein